MGWSRQVEILSFINAGIYAYKRACTTTTDISSSMQILKVVPYSAMQLYSYEVFKKAFSSKEGDLSVPGRLAAGACAGMTATLVHSFLPAPTFR